MACISAVTIRRARRDDVGVIVAMLADDPLGSGRERIEDPLPPSYFRAFEALEHDPNIRSWSREQGRRRRRLPAALHPAGIELAGRLARLIEDVRVATHCRSRGIGEQMVQWAVAEARARGCKLVELLTHNTRVDAQRFYKRLGFQPSHVGMTLRF